MAGARPDCVSERAKRRQAREMGTLGSGNHYLEMQVVAEIYDTAAATAFGLALDDVLLTIHCGSRGLGHQIGSDFLKEMAIAAGELGIDLPDRDLACAPIRSELGERYLGATRAAINCALATEKFSAISPGRQCGGSSRRHASISCSTSLTTPARRRRMSSMAVRGSFMSTAREPPARSVPATRACRSRSAPSAARPHRRQRGHGLLRACRNRDERGEGVLLGVSWAGRAMSRHAAAKRWSGRKVVDELAAQDILIRSPSSGGVAEEAPGANKDVGAVVAAAEHAGLARRVALVKPIICIKV